MNLGKIIRKMILKEAFDELKINNIDALNYLSYHYGIIKDESVKLYDDVHDTLQILKDKDYQLVLITNGDSERQRNKIKRFNLEPYFNYILIEGEQPFGKPDPRVYQLALSLCHIKENQACMVGDHYVWEVEAPIQLGLKGVWMNPNHRKAPDKSSIKPTMIITRISELLNQT